MASFWTLKESLVDLELSGLLGSVTLLEGHEDGAGILPRQPFLGGQCSIWARCVRVQIFLEKV